MLLINNLNNTHTESTIATYLAAAARVYGHVFVYEFLELYNSQNSPLTEEEFLAISKDIITDETPFLIISDKDIFTSTALPIDPRIVARSLTYATWDNLFTLEAAQEDLPLRILPEEEFLAYADPHYVPDTYENRQMLKFLTNNVKSPIDSEALLLEVLLQAEDDVLPKNCLFELQRLGVVFGDIQNRSEFVHLYQDAYDNARKPIHRGHTERELKMLDIPEERKHRRKVAWFLPEKYRYNTEPMDSTLLKQIDSVGYTEREFFNRKAHLNHTLPPRLYDPCFCGSGLKYMACCGNR